MDDKNNNNLLEVTDDFLNDKEEYFEKYAKSEKADTFLTKLIVISVLLSFILVGVVIFSPFDKLNTVNLGAWFKNAAQKVKNKNSIAESKEGFNLFHKRENILLLGVDSNGEESDPFENTRSDTIMIINLDSASKSVSVLSIPRDSKVYIAQRHGIDKINAAHALGGVDLTIQTIEDMFGIKVHHYIVANTQGVQEIVSALGTIPVNVEKRLKYTDYSGRLFIDLQPGKHDLNAKQVEEFIRFRHDLTGDIGRTERQRMLMKGLVTRLQSPDVIAKLPDIIAITNKYIKTDMTIFDLTRYAGIAKNVNLDDVQVATLPGHPSQNSIVSYWILEPEKVQDIIDRLIYRIEPETVSAAPLKVSILYDGNHKDAVEDFKAILKDNNAEIICEQKTKKVVPEIIAHNTNFSTQNYKNFKRLMPPLKSAHLTYAPDLYYCAESDVTVVLAGE
ncbi:MAG: LCP family protein [Candidatus Gastranaerophilales bacterium]|nr:LCP family protein [Candidatus Gastranaerophilales bacterium]